MFADNRRGRTLVLLVEYRVSLEDLALALNCSESIVRSFLAHQYRSFRPLAGTDVPGSAEAMDSRMLPRNERPVVAATVESQDGNAHGRATLARYLSLEVRRWLCTFDISDVERQHIIEQAGFLLDESPLNAAGEHDFQVNRVFLELLGIWGKSARSSHSPDFATRLSQWLASWIRFWVTDPNVWNHALDLEYAYFGTTAAAA